MQKATLSCFHTKIPRVEIGPSAGNATEEAMRKDAPAALEVEGPLFGRCHLGLVGFRAATNMFFVGGGFYLQTRHDTPIFCAVWAFIVDLFVLFPMVEGLEQQCSSKIVRQWP